MADERFLSFRLTRRKVAVVLGMAIVAEPQNSTLGIRGVDECDGGRAPRIDGLQLEELLAAAIGGLRGTCRQEKARRSQQGEVAVDRVKIHRTLSFVFQMIAAVVPQVA